MKNKYFITFILFILFCVFLFISIYSYANTISKDLNQNFFRLHILANSDSDEDQSLKLKVRDNILEYMEKLTYNNITKDEAILLTKDNLSNLEKITKQTISKEGYDYDVNLKIGNFYFPTKHYGNISLPAGYYDGLKIEIGKAKGQNWWCSLFPPLCFCDISSGIIDEDSSDILKQNLNNEEFNIITCNSKSVKFKFKLVELLSK